jgi:hypothetical protein
MAERLSLSVKASDLLPLVSFHIGFAAVKAGTSYRW